MPESVLGVIPARFGSRRFEGKPLALLGGKPLVQHVYERAAGCALLERVVVATDDRRIREAVEAFGGSCAMTSPDHLSGTDRVAEVAAGDSAGVVVNVQGDEPFVSPGILEQVVRPLLRPGSAPMATLAKPIDDPEVLADPNVVKVVTRRSGDALYFSRSPIPYPGRSAAHEAWEHIGIYAYRREFLLAFSRLEPTELEGVEGLEQLRALEHGYRIAVVPTADHVGVSVDTPEDLERARRLLERDGVPERAAAGRFVAGRQRFIQ